MTASNTHLPSNLKEERIVDVSLCHCEVSLGVCSTLSYVRLCQERRREGGDEGGADEAGRRATGEVREGRTRCGAASDSALGEGGQLDTGRLAPGMRCTSFKRTHLCN